MREILFRAKRTDNGEWVYGSLDNVCADKCRILQHNRKHGQLWNVRIFSETVGQYTGVKDRNGKKIFEGDIIKCTYIYEIGMGLRFDPKIDVVVYREGNFNPLYNCERNSFEVIGNIHDNPELLK